MSSKKASKGQFGFRSQLNKFASGVLKTGRKAVEDGFEAAAEEGKKELAEETSIEEDAFFNDENENQNGTAPGQKGSIQPIESRTLQEQKKAQRQAQSPYSQRPGTAAAGMGGFGFSGMDTQTMVLLAAGAGVAYFLTMG